MLRIIQKWDLPLLSSKNGKSHGNCHWPDYSVQRLHYLQISHWPLLHKIVCSVKNLGSLFYLIFTLALLNVHSSTAKDENTSIRFLDINKDLFIDISWFPHLPSQAGIGPSHVWLCGRPALPCLQACPALLARPAWSLPPVDCLLCWWLSVLRNIAIGKLLRKFVSYIHSWRHVGMRHW